MRLVIDTNVFVSGILFPRSTPGRLINVALIHHTVLHSSATLEELVEVLDRPKFDRWMNRQVRAASLTDLSEVCEIVSSLPRLRLCRDPNDDKYLELAVGGRAEYLVSGDEDLLILRRAGDAEIVTPASFLRRIAEDD